MTKKELIDLALRVCESNDDLRKAMQHSVTIDGDTYACDGHVAIRLSSKVVGSKVYKLPKDVGRYPDVKTLFGGRTIRVGWLSAENIKQHEGDIYDDYVVIGHHCFRGDISDTLWLITNMLGVKGWEVRKTDSRSGGMIFHADAGHVSMLLMPLMIDDDKKAGKSDDKVHFQLSEESIDVSMDLNSGKKWYADYMARQEQERKELEKRRKGNIFTFTVAKYAPMYVEAENIEEAKKIACKYCNEVDDSLFEDGEIEVSGYESIGGYSRRRSEFERRDKIFNVNGGVDVDDYDGFEE